MEISKTFTLDSIKIAIEQKRDRLRKISERDEITYDKTLDELNSLMIMADKLKR